MMKGLLLSKSNCASVDHGKWTQAQQWLPLCCGLGALRPFLILLLCAAAAARSMTRLCCGLGIPRLFHLQLCDAAET